MDSKNIINKTTAGGRILVSSSGKIRSEFYIENRIFYSELPQEELNKILEQLNIENNRKKHILDIKEKYQKGEIKLTEQEKNNYAAEFQKTEKNIRELEGQLRVVKIVEKEQKDKGKGKEKAPSTGKSLAETDIIKNLDLVIKDNEKSSVNLASSSKVDLQSKLCGAWYELANNKKRQELAKQLTGIDQIIYNKLEKSRDEKIGGFWENVFHVNENKRKSADCLTVNETKEIINELGITTKNQNTELLKNIKLAVIEQERKHKEQVEDLEGKLEKGEKAFNNQKTQLQSEKEARKEAEQEKTKGINKAREEARTTLNKVQSEKEIEIEQKNKEIENLTQQLEALTKAYNEETVERQKLEKIAKETAERINNNSLIPDLTKIELHEAKNTITQLSQTIEAQRGIITAGKISLESREKKIEDWKKTLEDVNQRHENAINAKIEEHYNRINEIRTEHSKEINEQAERYNKLLDENTKEINRLIDKEADLTKLNILYESEQKKLENAEARLNRADTEIINRGKEITEWKNKAEINEANCRDAKIAADQLRNQLREVEAEKNPVWYQKMGNWIGEKTGFTAAKNAISNVLNIVIIVLLFYGFSLLWKNLLKPAFSNFKSKKEKEEPKPRKKEPVRYDDYEEILESKKEPQALIEKEVRKPVVVINEPVNQREISSEKETPTIAEKTDPKFSEPQESKKAPKKRKNSQKKSKKKVKGDSS